MPPLSGNFERRLGQPVVARPELDQDDPGALECRHERGRVAQTRAGECVRQCHAEVAALHLRGDARCERNVFAGVAGDPFGVSTSCQPADVWREGTLSSSACGSASRAAGASRASSTARIV